MYEEYKTCDLRTVRLVVVGQFDPLFETASLSTKTPTLSTNDPAKEDLFQVPITSGELAQQNRMNKFLLMRNS